MSSGAAGRWSWPHADLLSATALGRPFQKPPPERPHMVECQQPHCHGTEVFVKATVTDSLIPKPPALFPQISLWKGGSMQPQGPVLDLKWSCLENDSLPLTLVLLAAI